MLAMADHERGGAPVSFGQGGFGKSRLPSVWLAQRKHLQGLFGASRAMAGMVLAVVQRRACASSAEQMATAEASQRLRRARVEQMEQGRSQGEHGRDEACDSPTQLG